jgi:hypothetical protein
MLPLLRYLYLACQQHKGVHRQLSCSLPAKSYASALVYFLFTSAFIVHLHTNIKVRHNQAIL